MSDLETPNLHPVLINSDMEARSCISVYKDEFTLVRLRPDIHDLFTEAQMTIALPIHLTALKTLSRPSFFHVFLFFDNFQYPTKCVNIKQGLKVYSQIPVLIGKYHERIL